MIEGDEWRRWVVELAWLWALLGFTLSVCVAWLLGRWQTLRRCRAMLAALNSSTRGQLVVTRGPAADGFAAHIEPPPEPFAQFAIVYYTRSRLDPQAWLLRDSSLQQDRLLIRARLDATPHQELQWVRGEIPGRARGREPHAILWMVQRVDFLQSEYATRGLNPGAIIHAFTELLARFEPLLYKITVLQEAASEVEVTLRGRGLNPDEIPPLVGLVRGLGRAARVE